MINCLEFIFKGAPIQELKIENDTHLTKTVQFKSGLLGNLKFALQQWNCVQFQCDAVCKFLKFHSSNICSSQTRHLDLSSGDLELEPHFGNFIASEQRWALWTRPLKLIPPRTARTNGIIGNILSPQRRPAPKSCSFCYHVLVQGRPPTRWNQPTLAYYHNLSNRKGSNLGNNG